MKHMHHSLTLVFLLCSLCNTSAQNILKNSGFEQGNTSFGTEYTYITTGGDAGNYTIANTANSFNGGFCTSIQAHSGTKMMIVDGWADTATHTNKRFWYTTANVIPNTTYTLSFYAVRMDSFSPAILEERINGTALGLQTLTQAACGWTKYTLTWNSGTSNTALIEMRSLANSVYIGNDFAIDDLDFHKGCP